MSNSQRVPAVRRPLPAYAKELADARRRGMRPRDPTVSVALHWRSRPGIGFGVVIPDDVEPTMLDWAWVRDLEVIIIRRGDASHRVMSAIGAIEVGRPRRLLVVDATDSRIISIISPPDEARHAGA